MTRIFITSVRGDLIAEVTTSFQTVIDAVIKMCEKNRWGYDVEQG